MAVARKRRRQPQRPARARQSNVFEDFLDDADPIEAVVDRLFENPRVQGVFQQIQESLDRFGFAVDRVGHAPRVARQPRPQAQPQTPPPRPRPAPRVNPLVEARVVMHFGPAEKLTREAVKRRRRDLAAMVHPDKPGGSVDAMKRINAAADALLKGL